MSRFKNKGKVCIAENCILPAIKKLLCDTHYQRFMAHGDQNYIKGSKGNDAERFEFYIERVTEAGCWIWMAGLTSYGHGEFSLQGGKVSAHRYSYIKSNGRHKKGMQINHICNVPSCVNPAHLYAGSHQDNMDDMVNAGRQVKGERQHSAKLNRADVVEIRNSGLSQASLARKYGVTHRAIMKVRKRITWKHVE